MNELPPHGTEPLLRAGTWRANALLPDASVGFLQAQAARLSGQIAVPRPWHYAELHNPWSRAGAAYDSWGFLDICTASMLIDNIAMLMGPDIILFDSQWLPGRRDSLDANPALESDAHRFPVDPPSGLTALVCCAHDERSGVGVNYRHPDPHKRGTSHTPDAPINVSIDLHCGDVLFVDSAQPYRIHSDPGNTLPTVYAIRYFPASSRYNRDPAAPVHRALTDRYPLLNYARMPLWLVQGQDRAANDFVTGFNVRAGFWTNANW
jgi:hypothetical protein